MAKKPREEARRTLITQAIMLGYSFAQADAKRPLGRYCGYYVRLPGFDQINGPANYLTTNGGTGGLRGEWKEELRYFPVKWLAAKAALEHAGVDVAQILEGHTRACGSSEARLHRRGRKRSHTPGTTNVPDSEV